MRLVEREKGDDEHLLFASLMMTKMVIVNEDFIVAKSVVSDVNFATMQFHDLELGHRTFNLYMLPFVHGPIGIPFIVEEVLA